MASLRKSANNVVKTTCTRLEALLESSPAFRKVEKALYVIKQGSCLVMISVHPWKATHVIIRLTAQLVKGVTMEVPLALELLELNAALRFGSFAWVPASEVVVFTHTLVERALSDGEEFLDTISDFAIVADEYDDRIAARYGGQTMEDLMEEQALSHMRHAYEHHRLQK